MSGENTDGPEAFLRTIRTAAEADAEKMYAERLRDARQMVRRAQDQADADDICRDRERSAARMAEYRRGRWYHLGAIITCGCAGFVSGYLTQKAVDVRLQGIPVTAVAGLPGLALGARLDESMWARACLAVGGAMFSVGAATYAHCNPAPIGALPEENT